MKLFKYIIKNNNYKLFILIISTFFIWNCVSLSSSEEFRFSSRAIQLQREKSQNNPYSHNEELSSPYSVGKQKSTIDHVNLWIYFKDKQELLNQQRSFSSLAESLDVNEHSLSRRQLRSENNKNTNIDNNSQIDNYDLPINEKYIEEVLAVRPSTQLKLRHRSKWLNAISISIHLDPELGFDAQDEELSKIVQDIQSISSVLKVVEVSQIQSAEDDQRLQSRITSSKTLRKADSNQTTANGIDYGQAFKQLDQIKIIDAHAKGYTGKGVTILIIDTGFYKDHESLQNCKIIAERNFIDDNDETQGELGDPQNTHGTYILSNLAAYKPGKMVGAAYNANYLLAKTEIVSKEIPVEEDYFISALEWGENKGVDIVTASLGYNQWYKYWDLTGSSPISKAVDIAISKGVVVVISSGNNGVYGLSPPADSKNCITVGAVDKFGQVASFSAVGPTADGRVKPEVVATGLLCFSADAKNPSSYGYQSGTSLSAPLIAGAAALILQAHPDWTPAMVKESLLSTAETVEPDNYKGYGLVDTVKAIDYIPGKCTNCSGSCLKNECHSNIVECGYVCKQNGGVCNPYNCNNCVDPKAKLVKETVSVPCKSKLNEDNQINLAKIKQSNPLLMMICIVLFILFH